MKFINVLTLALIIVGGINWGLVGLFQYDLVAAIFGGFARVIFALVGLSALWQIAPWTRSVSSGEVAAEAAVRRI